MKRRSFFRNTSLAALGAGLTPTLLANSPISLERGPVKTTKNIIFLVSDGMSSGTLNMADLLAQRKLGRSSHWIQLYHNGKVKRALMDTASASSIVTDSAAASSSWGGGVRVPNGRLNVGADGTLHQPILQKFKAAGKAVGCVTSVPITHATPAGFCVNNNSRGNQAEIAEQYLDLRFDVMLGGGLEYFDPSLRKDKVDVFEKYVKADYTVFKTKSELNMYNGGNAPIMGVFHESAIPYALDHAHDETKKDVPTLPEMTAFAINQLKKKPEGFVLQIEGGKVDWAAHGNDVGGLLYDQLAFDEAVRIAMDFAENRDDTLVIITTDHGNANPALLYGKNADQNFDRLHQFNHTNEWILMGLDKSLSGKQLKERINYAQGITFDDTELKVLTDHLKTLKEEDFSNSYKLPFEKLAQLQKTHTNVGWAGMHHSADYVELAMYGPGSELLPDFVKNTDLHNFMLNVAGVMK